MFKLVIVEDEDNIRHSLECFIPWEKMGFQVVNTFSDGSDALAYLKEHPCDVVLTDILMSRMSGLEMIRNLYDISPHTKVVILSGHSDFAYAQQAIQYRVVHYLIKPVDEDELMDVFKNLKEQLDYEREEAVLAESDKRDLKWLLQKSFFRNLLSGAVFSGKELSVYSRLLGMESIQPDACLLAFEIEARLCDQTEADVSVIAPEGIFRKYLKTEDAVHTFFFEEKTDCWRVVFVGAGRPNSESLRKQSNEKMQALIGELNECLPCKFTYRVTHSVTRLTDLLMPTKKAPPSEQQVDEALCRSALSDYKILIVELDLGCTDTLRHILNGIAQKLEDTSLETMRFIFKNLYSVIELNYRKRKIDVLNVTGGKFNFNHLYGANNPEELVACLCEDFCTLADRLKSQKHISEHTVIKRVVQYLDEHLDEDIGHDSIAAKYRIHPGYLSRLFKQEMGETLSEHLLRIKIERAALLLKERKYKIGEIAGIVGYSAPSYFSIMFKKYTGYSPREYCQRVSL